MHEQLIWNMRGSFYAYQQCSANPALRGFNGT
jgi:hypothetical protein